MNDKLAKFAGQNVRPKPAGGLSPALVSITKQNLKGSYYYMRVSLHKRTTRRLGWKTGDYIRVAITNNGDISLSRDNQNQRGRLLRKTAAARTKILFRVTYEFFDALPVGDGINVEIDDDQIIFGLESND